MCKALGSQNYFINPKRCFCPFISKKRGTKCGVKSRGTVELNRLNELSNFVSHLETKHVGNRAAQAAAVRLKKASSFPKMTTTQLDGFAKIDWEDTGDEAVRPIADYGDAFEPEFELGSNEHAEWVKTTIAQGEYDPEAEAAEQDETE